MDLNVIQSCLCYIRVIHCIFFENFTCSAVFRIQFRALFLLATPLGWASHVQNRFGICPRKILIDHLTKSLSGGRDTDKKKKNSLQLACLSESTFWFRELATLLTSYKVGFTYKTTKVSLIG